MSADYGATLPTEHTDRDLHSPAGVIEAIQKDCPAGKCLYLSRSYWRNTLRQAAAFFKVWLNGRSRFVPFPKSTGSLPGGKVAET